MARASTERSTSERVLVTLPAELLDAVDSYARQQRRKRSQVIRQALQELLDRERQREFEELLAEGYREQAELLAELVEEFMPLQAEAAENVWVWDERPDRVLPG